MTFWYQNKGMSLEIILNWLRFTKIQIELNMAAKTKKGSTFDILDIDYEKANL